MKNCLGGFPPDSYYSILKQAGSVGAILTGFGFILT